MRIEINAGYKAFSFNQLNMVTQNVLNTATPAVVGPYLLTTTASSCRANIWKVCGVFLFITGACVLVCVCARACACVRMLACVCAYVRVVV